MNLVKNTFKQQLNADTRTIGLWLGLPDQSAVEISAGAGFDWLLIDAEHAPWETRDLLTALQVIAAYPVAPIVRPLNDDPAQLKRLLDIGVQSFLIPMVHSAEQATKIISTVRYPPRGVRGLGTSLARAARWNRVEAYIDQANDEICIIVQIESVEGLENIEAIANVDGVDAIFIGPSDLGAALGFPGQPTHPDVVIAVEEAIHVITKLGKPAGVLAPARAQFDIYAKAGATFIGVGTDTGVLASGTKVLADTFQGRSDGITSVKGSY